MAFPDTIPLDTDGGTTDRTFVKQADGKYIADDSNLGAPHLLTISHRAIRAASGSIDQHNFGILRSEEDASGTLARAEFKVVVNVPQKVLTTSHLEEVRRQAIDFFSSASYWDSLLRSET